VPLNCYFNEAVKFTFSVSCCQSSCTRLCGSFCV